MWKKTLKKKVDHLASNGFWKISSLGGSKMGHLLDPTWSSKLYMVYVWQGSIHGPLRSRPLRSSRVADTRAMFSPWMVPMGPMSVMKKVYLWIRCSVGTSIHSISAHKHIGVSETLIWSTGQPTPNSSSIAGLGWFLCGGPKIAWGWPRWVPQLVGTAVARKVSKGCVPKIGSRFIG